jgi:hypothetical protein
MNLGDDGHVSLGGNEPQQEITGTVLAHTVPDEFYRAQLSDFNRGVVRDLANRFMYQVVNR